MTATWDAVRAATGGLGRMRRARARTRLLGVVGVGTSAVLLWPTAASSTAGPDESPTTAYVVQSEDLGNVAEVLADLGAVPEATFEEVGSLTVQLDTAQVALLQQDPLVDGVSPEQQYSIETTQTSSTPWGLDRLDQATLPLDGRFTYADDAGAGVRVYVVDTGITGGAQLGGRLAAGTNTTGDARGTVDCHGHGTHVAGTVAGTAFGVAKQATVVPVRVLGCTGGGTTSTVIAGLDWIAAHHPAGTRGVVNLSLGSVRDAPLDAAVEALVQQGFVVVAAAGNDAADACTTSPAGAPSALTVGASDENDARADFSNFGPCLDVFAPGTRIVSTSLVYPSGAELRSGTSMAAPHVAGVAALALAAAPESSPGDVAEMISRTATVPVSDARSTDVHLLSSDVSWLTDDVDAVAPSSPREVRPTWVTPTRTTVSWAAPRRGSELVTGYVVEHSVDGAHWTPAGTVPAGTTSLDLVGLSPSTTYQVRAAATGGTATSSPATWSPRTAVSTARASTRAERWFERTHLELLGRSPDNTSLSVWSARMTQGWTRTRVGKSLTMNADYRNRAITRLYAGSLGYTPDANQLATWRTAMGGGATLPQIEARLLASSEHYKLAGFSAQGWLDHTVRDALGRPPTAAEITRWSADARSSTGRLKIATALVSANEHLAPIVDERFRTLLGRPATATERSTWVIRFKAGTPREELDAALVGSIAAWSATP